MSTGTQTTAPAAHREDWNTTGHRCTCGKEFKSPRGLRTHVAQAAR